MKLAIKTYSNNLIAERVFNRLGEFGIVWSCGSKDYWFPNNDFANNPPTYLYLHRKTDKHYLMYSVMAAKDGGKDLVVIHATEVLEDTETSLCLACLR